MRNLIFFSLLLILFSCNDLVEKPNNLISKGDMSEIIADMALNDQLSFINPKGNMESGTRYILQQHHVIGDDFIKSYQYYTYKKSMKGILEDAQDMLKDKDPKAEDFIEKKLKQTDKVPAFAR